MKIKDIFASLEEVKDEELYVLKDGKAVPATFTLSVGEDAKWLIVPENPNDIKARKYT